MGAYGSPELGPFSNNNKRRKPQNNMPATFFMLIVAGVIAAIMVKCKGLPVQPQPQAKNSYVINLTNDRGEQTSNPKISKNGILSYQTGVFLISSKEINHAVIDLIDTMIDSVNTGTINTVQTQMTLNSIQEELDRLKDQSIDKAYVAYKEEIMQAYQATIILLENYLANGNITYQNLVNLRNSYAEEMSNTYDELIQLFDENDIEYQERINEDGTKQLEYRYMSQ